MNLIEFDLKIILFPIWMKMSGSENNILETKSKNILNSTTSNKLKIKIIQFYNILSIISSALE